jgi:protein FAM32A
MTTTFTGGALSFKGEKRKKAKRKSRKSKHKIDEEKKEKESHVPAVLQEEDDDDLTEAERKALKRKLEKERQDLEKVAAKSHRERIEEFNEKLGNLTEHNDIPRVSAAGNG